MNLTSLSFNYRASNPTSTSTIDVRSSATGDSFATRVGGVVGFNNTTFVSQSVSLTGAAFQGLTAPVEFRLYIFDSSTSTTRFTQIDNVVLAGTAVPEPTTGALLAGAAMMLVFQRRRAAKMSA